MGSLSDARQIRWTDVVTGAQRMVEVDGANYDEAASIAQALSYWFGARDVALYVPVFEAWLPVYQGAFDYADHVTETPKEEEPYQPGPLYIH